VANNKIINKIMKITFLKTSDRNNLRLSLLFLIGIFSFPAFSQQEIRLPKEGVDILKMDIEDGKFSKIFTIKKIDMQNKILEEWTFSSNIELTCTSSDSIYLKKNKITLRQSFKELKVSLRPDFSAPSHFSITNAENRTVFMGIVKYPILALNLDRDTIPFSKDEVRKCSIKIQNLGLDTLTAKIHTDINGVKIYPNEIKIVPESEENVELNFDISENVEEIPIVIHNAVFPDENKKEMTLYVAPQKNIWIKSILIMDIPLWLNLVLMITVICISILIKKRHKNKLLNKTRDELIPKFNTLINTFISNIFKDLSNEQRKISEQNTIQPFISKINKLYGSDPSLIQLLEKIKRLFNNYFKNDESVTLENLIMYSVSLSCEILKTEELKEQFFQGKIDECKQYFLKIEENSMNYLELKEHFKNVGYQSDLVKKAVELCCQFTAKLGNQFIEKNVDEILKYISDSIKDADNYTEQSQYLQNKGYSNTAQKNIIERAINLCDSFPELKKLYISQTDFNNCINYLKIRINDYTELDAQYNSIIEGKEYNKLDNSLSEQAKRYCQIFDLYKKSQEISSLTVYINCLRDLDKALSQIRNIQWKDKSKKFIELSLRVLKGTESDKLKKYIRAIEQFEILPPELPDKQEFIGLFTEIFRLNAFVKVSPPIEKFYKLPFFRYESTLLELQAFWLEVWNIEVIVPRLFSEKINEQFHLDVSTKTSPLILSSQIFSFNDKNIELKTIKEFNTIGLVKDGKVIEKAEVFIKKENE
jgi:hypothetical protein